MVFLWLYLIGVLFFFKAFYGFRIIEIPVLYRRSWLPGLGRDIIDSCYGGILTSIESNFSILTFNFHDWWVTISNSNTELHYLEEHNHGKIGAREKRLTVATISSWRNIFLLDNRTSSTSESSCYQSWSANFIYYSKSLTAINIDNPNKAQKQHKNQKANRNLNIHF